MVVASILTTISCSDWSDWNEAQTYTSDTSSEQNLWENITSNPELQNFKTILERVGMQETFQTNKFYTIWAPIMTDAQRDSVLLLDEQSIRNQFVNNHIAEYNHQATGVLSERVHTINEKAYGFSGMNSVYTFNNVKLKQANIPNSNGTLHILESTSPYLPNAYQSMWMTDDVDSIADYFKRHEIADLDENKSIPGPIVDGRQTYLDSVMTTYNSISKEIRAELDDEDSIYTFILPNNEAYTKKYEAIKSLYKYTESMQAQDVANAEASTFDIITGSTNVDYLNQLSDSLIRRQIVNYLVYSHTNGYNKAYFEEGSLAFDTIVSTFRENGRNRMLSEPDMILDKSHILRNVRLSNGEAIVIDTLGFKSWETYNQEILTRGYNACRTLRGSGKVITVYNEHLDPSMVTMQDNEDFSYFELTPTATSSKPEADYYLREVLSGTYRIYAVIPPASIVPEDTTTSVYPNWLTFTLNYYNGTKLVDYTFTNERFDPNNNEVITYNPDNGTEVRTTIDNTDFFNDTTKVDTLFLGEFTFPYCYYGLTNVYPNIKVTISSKMSTLKSRGHLNAFDRTLRIGSIIMRPIEYDKYLKDEE